MVGSYWLSVISFRLRNLFITIYHLGILQAKANCAPSSFNPQLTTHNSQPITYEKN